jgi:hypothetical protein
MIPVTRGQLAYELEHLRMKLRHRNSQRLRFASKRSAAANPMFTVVDGSVEPWERPLNRALSGP